MKLILRSTLVGLAIALSYLAWVGFSRYNADRQARHEAVESERERYRKLVPQTTELKITQFYASRQETARGENVLICYGVENARSVRIEPPLDQQLRPLPAKCVPYTPHRTTTFKLVAEGERGGEATALVTVKVK